MKIKKKRKAHTFLPNSPTARTPQKHPHRKRLGFRPRSTHTALPAPARSELAPKPRSRIRKKKKQNKENKGKNPGAHLANSATQLCITVSGQTTKKGRVPVARRCAAKAIVWRVKIKCFTPRGPVRAGVDPHEHVLAEVR
jgi:hypothetical protein